MVAVNFGNANDDAKKAVCVNTLFRTQRERIDRITAAIIDDKYPMASDCYELALSVSAMFISLNKNGVSFNDA